MDKGTSVIFEYKLKNIYEAFLFENILIQKELLWRIKFIFIKFFLNNILLEKIRNERRKPSFLHKATCIQSDHG